MNKKGARYLKMTRHQRVANRIKSKVRARVEHVFGAMRNRPGGLTVRSIGLMRSTADITLQNRNGKTALDLAIEADKTNVIEYLRHAHAALDTN